MELGLFLILLMNIGLISADWNQTAFTKPTDFPCEKIHTYDEEKCPNWIFDPNKPFLTAFIKFEEEQQKPLLIAYIHCTDCNDKKAPMIGAFSDGSRSILAPVLEKVEDGKYSLTINNKLDYEIKEHQQFKFSIMLEDAQEDTSIKVKIDLIDIDDEPTRVKVHQTPCNIPENYEGKTNCTYFIEDPDTNGLKNLEFIMDAEYEKHFEIMLKSINNNQADAVLWIRENKPLDFETMPMYFFELIAQDMGKNNGSALIMIRVKDMNDQPPKWIDIFAMKSFDEHEIQSFNVSAKDGDLEINDEINYDLDCGHFNDRITITKSSDKKGNIEISEIDRDTKEIEDNDNTIKCILIATEESDSTYNATAEINFIIQDINDNKPLIVLSSNQKFPVILREEEFTTLEQIFAIGDIDQGNNAQFDVTLENDAGTFLKINYTEPFQVIPNNGYRNWDFAISVVKPELLDYDKNADWRKFSLKIHSKDKGIKPEQQVDDKIIKIELMNLNDEIPIFDETIDYNVKIPENATIDTYILNVLATDDDYNDTVEYSLPSGDKDYKLKTFTNKSATLYTKRDNVFDYEKVKTVFIQITATDTLTITGEPINLHSVTKQITVEVQDVNDEKPRINLSYESPNIDEHSDVGIEITSSITAEDPDTTAYLRFTINWEKSRVSKLGSQSTNTSWFENVFTIETVFPDQNTNGSAVGILKVFDNFTLDYEVFDTIFLNIQVEDLLQEINNGTDEGTLTIIINDINDNPPEFQMETINSQKQVTEEEKSEFRIATIVAIDIDGPKFNNVTYELVPIDDTDDGLVKIDPKSGDLLVDENMKINADCPRYIKYLNYTVIATDGKFRPSKPIKIYIEDLNNKSPELKTPLKNDRKIYERKSTDPNEPIQKAEGIDCDRDDPHNKIKYELNNEITQLSEMFGIDAETGDIYAHGNIEWSKQETMTIYILLKDNIGGTGQSKIERFNFTVTIIDIDNNPPVLPEINFPTIKEDAKSGAAITKIIATDKDKPCTEATKIQYSIVQIKDSKDNEVPLDLFELEKIEGPEPKCEQIAELKVKSSLKDHYGKISISIRAQNPTPENYDVKSYILTVDPVNYKKPKIISPDDSVIILQKDQEAGKKLIAIDGKFIKDFEATDDQKGKFEMFFEPDLPWDDDFKFILKPDDEKNKARLTLTTNTPSKTEYTLNIKARHEVTGAEQNFVTKTITIKLVDESQLPTFEIFEANISFWENVTDIKCKTFPPAVEPKCGTAENDNCRYETHYHITNSEERVYFETNANDTDHPEVCLKKYLDTETQPYHYLIIVATNDKAPPPRVPDGYKPLKITVKADDVNDNPPSFVSKTYTNGLADTDKIDSVIVTLEATDPDEVDQGKLRYEILEDTIIASDDSIQSIKDSLFYIDGNTIKNQKQPTQSMQGYFLFTVVVLDTLNFTDSAEVKIHIISDANRVIFKFNENIDSVKSKEKEIKDIFSVEFGYSCIIDEYLKISNDTETRANSFITEVKTHFIDEQEKPVDKERITVKLGDLALVGRLRMRCEVNGLTLIHVDNESATDEIQDMKFLLQILLGVVSVVLGTLCIILIVAFILRTRSLNKRLEAMTTNVFGSTKSDLNRIGISAPGTNRHAIEANPVWNEDLNNAEQFDTMSQDSGGSDLIGVEDRPDFAYDNRRASINPVLQHKMSKQENYDDDDDDDDDEDIRSLPDSVNKNSTLF